MIEILFERGALVEFAEFEYGFHVSSTHPYFTGTLEDALRNIPRSLNLADGGDHLFVEFSVEAVEVREDWGRWKVLGEREDLDLFKKSYMS